MATTADALQYLQVAMGDHGTEFREGQWEAIDHIPVEKLDEVLNHPNDTHLIGAIKATVQRAD